MPLRTLPKVMHINFYSCVRDNPDGSSDKVQISFARGLRHWQPILAGKGNTTGYHTYHGLDCYGFAEDRLKNRILNKWFGLGVFTFSSVIDLIERERPAILHFHFRHEFIDHVVRRLSYQPKVVVHYHRRYKKLIVPHSADVLIAVSENIRDHIRAEYPTQTPVRVIHNPLPEEIMRRSGKPAAPRQKPVLLFGGGRFQHKGFFDLIQAVETLASDTFELRLCGHEFADYAPARPEVKVLGFLPTDCFIKLMLDSDVVVVPSHHESFGLLALEAMYCHRLVIATKNTGLESFCDNRNAILVEPAHPASLAAGIKQALTICRDQPAVYFDKTTRAFQTSQRFTSDHLAGELESVYGELVAGATPAPLLADPNS